MWNSMYTRFVVVLSPQITKKLDLQMWNLQRATFAESLQI